MSDTSYNEEIDEFAPAKPSIVPSAPAPTPAPAPVPPAPAPVPAPVPAPESGIETGGKVYDTIIGQQSEQIKLLIEQNERLSSQIAQLIQSGAQIGVAHGVQAANPLQQFNSPSLAESDDWSLESLAKDIGKKQRH